MTQTRSTSGPYIRGGSVSLAPLVILSISFAGCFAGNADNPNVERLIVPPNMIWARDSERNIESRVLWPMFSHRTETESSGTGSYYYRRRSSALYGLIYSARADNYGGGQLKVNFLAGLGQYFRGQAPDEDDGRLLRTVRSFRLLPIVGYKRSWRSVNLERDDTLRLPSLDDEPTAEEDKTVIIDERMSFHLLQFVLGWQSDPTYVRRFVLGGVLPHDDGTRTTFGAWAQERGPSADSEDQLFWRIVLYKRWGSQDVCRESTAMDKPSAFWHAFQWLWHGPPRTRVRLGPLMTYESDWLEDKRRFSILAGLFSSERTGRDRRGRILWFIPWRIRHRGY